MSKQNGYVEKFAGFGKIVGNNIGSDSRKTSTTELISENDSVVLLSRELDRYIIYDFPKTCEFLSFDIVEQPAIVSRKNCFSSVINVERV